MRTEMATEKPTLPAPEEPVSPAAEDVQATPAVTAEVPETPNPAAEAPAEAETAPVAETPAEAAAGETEPAEAPAGAEEAPAEEAAPRAKRARIQPAAEPVAEAAEEAVPADVQVDFADEEAALAAQNAGLEIEDETPEEEAADRLAGETPDTADKFAGKGKEELVALFARMLEEQPVQSIRRDVEALKIAFYRIRRAEVEAAVSSRRAAPRRISPRRWTEPKCSSRSSSRYTVSAATPSSPISKPRKRPI